MPLPTIHSNVTTAVSSRRPSTSMLDTAAAEDRRSSLTPSTSSSCHSRVDRVSSISHVVRALKLTWSNKRSDLFTAWIHVPLGITALLVFVWVIKLGMDKAPFNFPSPVLAMVALFALMLLLDRLSTSAIVQARFSSGTKPLLAPVLAVLEPPCDFCLRYMSVMFTPSFILIPARELIDGREIGLLTGWFAATQILALLFPVYLHRGIHAVKSAIAARIEKKRMRKEEKAAARRTSLATIVSIADHVHGPGEKENLDTEKVYSGVKLGKIAQGLSGATAVATAPLVVTRKYHYPTASEISAQLLQEQATVDQDQQRHITRVQMETARQQGDPYVTSPRTEISSDPFCSSPLDSSNDFAGVRPHHFFSTHQHHSHLHTSTRRTRSASRMRTTSSSNLKQGAARPSSAGVDSSAKTADSFLRSTARRPASSGQRPASSSQRLGRSALRNQFAPSPPHRSASTPANGMPVFNEAIFNTAPTPAHSAILQQETAPDEKPADATVATHRDLPRLDISHDQDPVQVTFTEEDSEAKRRECGKTMHSDASLTKTAEQDVEAQPGSEDGTEEDEDEPDAVERLSERFADAITPTIYALVLVAGLPLFYLVNISLPLFLAINLFTFLGSITVVPPQIRRYAHPILTTSIATVLIIWGLGAARGWSLKQTLASYSVDAKYSDIWVLSGYKGPVIGAGDVLFSTLDAGIVSLAIPMYRYRRDLYQRFSDMLLVLFPCAMLSLFAWPSIAHLIGIAPERSLAFASRFMSTPLAIELSITIGADESITVILVVITGILTSVFKDHLFRLLKVDPNDSLTIGIAMGSTSGAIGASSLISKPKTMAIASLSFVLFGAILLIFAAIPPIVDIVRTLAGAAMLV